MRGQERIYTDKQVAEILGMSVQTLRNHRHERRGISYIKIGRSVRYTATAIEEFLEKNKVKTQVV